MLPNRLAERRLPARIAYPVIGSALVPATLSPWIAEALTSSFLLDAGVAVMAAAMLLEPATLKRIALLLLAAGLGIVSVVMQLTALQR
jgi:heme/copper-type cytochrome/quinol oxidase subunit 3